MCALLLSPIMMTECGKISRGMLFCDFHDLNKTLRIFFQTWRSDDDGGGGVGGGGGGGREGEQGGGGGA